MLYLILQVGRRKGEDVIRASYRRYRRSFLDEHGGFFDEELAQLARDEACKKDNRINWDKGHVISTKQQQRSIAETYVGINKGVNYPEQCQSHQHLINNVSETVKSKEMEKEQHDKKVFDKSPNKAMKYESNLPRDDSDVMENLQDSFAEKRTKDDVISLLD